MKTNTEIIEDLKVLQKCMAREGEGFRLIKDEVLLKPDMNGLLRLRELARTRYQSTLRDIFRDLRELGSSISPDESGWEEVSDLLTEVERDLKELQAHMVSTPSRLIRLLKSGALTDRESVDFD